MNATCGHLVCELAKGSSCQLRVDDNFGFGGPVEPSTVPPAVIASVRELIDGLDREAIKVELARRKLERDVSTLLEIVECEKHACKRPQATGKIRERSAQLLDKLAAIKGPEDLDVSW